MEKTVREPPEGGVEIRLSYLDDSVKVIARFLDHRDKGAAGLTAIDAVGALVYAYPEMFGVRRIRWSV